jgi:hypothetical protein
MFRMPADNLIVTVNGEGERAKKNLRLAKWIIFTVLFAVGPLFANLLAIEDESHFTWAAVIGRGELFVIAAAITGDGLGRIWGQRAVNGVYGTLCFGALAFVLLATCVEFGWISRDLAAVADLKIINPSHIRNSLIIFGAAVAAAFSAVIIEE